MFERGIIRHSREILVQPILNVPLLIFPPGGQERLDVSLPTSAVDVLPTLLHVTGQEVPDWCEGRVLPPFADTTGMEERLVYAQHLRDNNPNRAVNHGSFAIVQGDYKLTYYYGWPMQQGEGELVELYDIRNDPEEMEELSSREKDRAGYLLDMLKTEIDRAEEPFRK